MEQDTVSKECYLFYTFVGSGSVPPSYNSNNGHLPSISLSFFSLHGRYTTGFAYISQRGGGKGGVGLLYYYFSMAQMRDVAVAQPKVFKKIVNQMFTLEILKAVGHVFKTLCKKQIEKKRSTINLTESLQLLEISYLIDKVKGKTPPPRHLVLGVNLIID